MFCCFGNTNTHYIGIPIIPWLIQIGQSIALTILTNQLLLAHQKINGFGIPIILLLWDPYYPLLWQSHCSICFGIPRNKLFSQSHHLIAYNILTIHCFSNPNISLLWQTGQSSALMLPTFSSSSNPNYAWPWHHQWSKCLAFPMITSFDNTTHQLFCNYDNSTVSITMTTHYFVTPITTLLWKSQNTIASTLPIFSYFYNPNFNNSAPNDLMLQNS